MVKSFLICDVTKFQTEEYSVPIQQMIHEDEEGLPSINVAPTINKIASFNVINCEYDKKVKVYGKVFDRPFRYYFVPEKFNVYINEEIKLAIISIKSETAIEFIESLNNTPDYLLKPIEIDYDYMEPLIDEITVAWISGLKTKHIKTKGLIGNHVNRSVEFKEAIKMGKISAMNIKFKAASGEEHTVGITKKGSIVLYDKFDSVESEINIVMSIYNKLIKKPAMQQA